MKCPRYSFCVSNSSDVTICHSSPILHAEKRPTNSFTDSKLHQSEFGILPQMESTQFWIRRNGQHFKCQNKLRCREFLDLCRRGHWLPSLTVRYFHGKLWTFIHLKKAWFFISLRYLLLALQNCTPVAYFVTTCGLRIKPIRMLQNSQQNAIFSPTEPLMYVKSNKCEKIRDVVWDNYSDVGNYIPDIWNSQGHFAGFCDRI